MSNSGFIKKVFIKFLITAVCFISIVPLSQATSLNQIEHKRKVTQQKIKTLKLRENQEKSKLVKNQRQLEHTRSNLHASQSQYNALESQLVSLENQLNSAITEYNNSNKAMRGRVRHIYKTQRRGMFQLLFSAKDLNSMLDIVYFEKIILKRDYQRMMAVKAKSESIAAIKSSIYQKKLILASTIKDINVQQQSIKGAIAQNQSIINKLKSNRAAYERSERELARQSANIQNMIARSQGKTKVSYGASGGFLKPIGGSITSPFGWRVHPIFKSRTFHSGVDIGGPNGGAIRASNAGRVIYSGWYGGYGKVVIIDHGTVNGNPTTTLYAHMSSILVSQGQSVSKGQTIGREGSTGYSTGPHCHFEVRINGKPNNPLRFI